MSTQSRLSFVLMTALLTSSCGDSPLRDAELLSAQGNLRTCPNCPPEEYSNGTGVNIGYTGAPDYSYYGFYMPDGRRWYLTGFTNLTDLSGNLSVRATGWYNVAPDSVAAADASIPAATYKGVTHTVQRITTGKGTTLSVSLRNPSSGSTITVSGQDLLGIVLRIQVPSYTATGTYPYYLRIHNTALPVSGTTFQDVNGYHFSYMSSEAGIPTWTNYCNHGAESTDIPAVLYQGSQWNPLTGARTDTSTRVALTCRTGAIAQCMAWGYRPWATATNTSTAQIESLRNAHQACIHMKRASYCGDSHQYTHDGVEIGINDQYGGAISPMVTPLGLIEAEWSTSGATCLSTTRLLSPAFPGCANPLPSCPAQLSSTAVLRSSVAQQQ
ncbi:MAG: ADYC domain-containing protein [Polyangia bacterium]